MKDQMEKELINKRVKNYLASRKCLNTCYNAGKMLSEAGKRYGVFKTINK